MSLLKELAKLAEPAPSLPDLEDETFEDNKVSNSKFDEGDDGAPVRRRISGSQFHDDERYAGEKVKRCDIFGTNDVSDDEFEKDFPQDEESNYTEDPTQIDSSEEDAADEDDYVDDEEDEEVSISEGELHKAIESGNEGSLSGERSVADDSEEEDEASDLNQTTNNMKNIMLGMDKDKESKKATSVREQLKTWDQLLFLKIKLQAASRAYNCLPRGHLAKELMKNCDEETRNNVLLARKNAKELVELLLAAEKALLGSSSLTQSIVGIIGGMADSDDEEIESSEDEVEEDDDEAVGDEEGLDDEEEEKAPKEKPSMSWKAQEKRLKENETKFDKFRSSTLVKWDERTKLTGPRRAKDARKDFSAFEQGSVVQQIDKIMADKLRILKRSQTKRSDRDRIGANPEADVDEEIFDDDDFYQILLKEMIDKKTSASQDPIAMTRSFIEMQNLRNKRSKKRVFDNKLSKDRKVKYVPIPKLVNFHPARPELVTWTHESRNELFKSLFK